jgi:pyruvate kinase
MIRTKIVATLGPASSHPERLYELFVAGVDVCRLNFSHGTLDEALQMLRNIRQAATRWKQPIAVLGDLCGPKIRLGKVSDQNGTGGMPIATGDDLIIQREPIVGGQGRVSSIYKHLVDDVLIGHRVLIEDGLLRFICIDKSFGQLVCKCTAGGILKTSKGINLPDSSVSIPSITDRDWECVDWAIENDLDYLALSFVRKAEDLQLLREHLTNKAADIHLIAKIEMSEALKQIDAIIDASDGLMVARGDLGVEMDMAEVPIIQKDLIRRCQTAGKPVIVATQMLQSMIEASSPTRAEVSDVANAIFDGADAVMLSGETSVGKFPVDTVLMMAHIAEVTEKYLAKIDAEKEPNLKLKMLHLSAAVAQGVWRIVHVLKAKIVVVWSQTGATARIFSKLRFNIPIVALSSDHRALRRMAIHYGVLPQELAAPNDLPELVAQTEELVRAQMASIGDRIVIVAGSSMGTPGTMNSIIVHTLGDPWTTTGASTPFPRRVQETEET